MRSGWVPEARGLSAVGASVRRLAAGRGAVPRPRGWARLREGTKVAVGLRAEPARDFQGKGRARPGR